MKLVRLWTDARVSLDSGLGLNTGSEGGLVQFGVYPVLFGYRVRAGFTDSWAYELDWCAGDDWTNVERLYSLCHAILAKRPEDDRCFEGLPSTSAVKPFFRDESFTKLVVTAAGDCELIRLPRLWRAFDGIYDTVGPRQHHR